MTVKLVVNVDEELLENMVTELIADKLAQNSEVRFGLRKGIEEAVKEYIYSSKEVIIERVVDRATREIVKKGLPKLLKEVME